MTETIVENPVCQACGAAVRPGAMFCYQCGAQVATDLPPVEVESPKEEEKSLPELVEKNGKAIEKTEKESNKVKNKKPVVREEVKLKTAAAIRQKSPIAARKTVEIVWEAPDNAPNVWFIIVAAGLIMFTIAILFATLYIH